MDATLQSRAEQLATEFAYQVTAAQELDEAIRTAYPQTRVQRCIVHLVRAALRYVSTEESKQVVHGVDERFRTRLPTVGKGNRRH